MPDPFVSIVVPAYNESARIQATLESLVSFLCSHTFSWEVVIADDGSTDATAAIVSDFAARTPGVRLLSLPHRGKGWAVRHGILSASGTYRFICDADLSMPVEQLLRFLPAVPGDHSGSAAADVLIGSRALPESCRFGEPLSRYLMSRLYHFLVALLVLPGIQDTQCGFKCFRGEVVRSLFERLTVHGFAFDVEVLFLAAQSGLRIEQVGIDWHYQKQSKVRLLRDSLTMTFDLFMIRWRHRSRR